jgi:hypothetical protein
MRNVGWALILVGTLDIGLMIYSISQNISYSSGGNLFAIIGGILLLRGNVKAAKVIRWCSAFYLVTLLLVILIVLFQVPLKLLLVQFNSAPSSFLLPGIFMVVLAAFVSWVYLQLSAKSMLEAHSAQGYKIGFPRSTIITVVVLAAIILALSWSPMYEQGASMAKQLAEDKLGSEYNYHVSQMSFSGNSGKAVVWAYDDEEIREIQVEW